MHCCQSLLQSTMIEEFVDMDNRLFSNGIVLRKNMWCLAVFI